MSLQLREVSVADADTIANIFRTSFVDTFGRLYPPTDLAQFLSERSAAAFEDEINDRAYLFRLAVVGGRAAGYIKLGPPGLPVEAPPDSIEICQLYVDKEWHGTGVARELMTWALDEVRSRGRQHVQLSVYIDNHRALRFYERHGFAPVGRYDFKVGTHIDEDIILRHVVLQADP
jgi:ribosomal protein S18 acetylase RimI-like enzyme